jgi:DNA-binding transcriptional LysR family regulator
MDQHIELRHLRYFVAVAEELHFGHAAERLHIAQPPLSQQIRRLEEEIGCPLFTRSSRSVKLTPAGSMLLERARRTLGRVRDDLEAVRSAARGESGTLTIGFVGSAMLTSLPSLLGRYRRAYPKVQLRLREQNTASLVEAIRDGSIDTGFARDADPAEDLHIEPMVMETFVAVVPKAHPLAKRLTVPMASLRNEAFVFFPRSMGNHAWEKTMRLCDEQGFRPNIVQEAPQWLTLLRLVGAGLGVTLAPESVRRIPDSGVVCRKLSPKSGSTSIDLTYPAKPQSPLVENFHALARAMLRR